MGYCVRAYFIVMKKRFGRRFVHVVSSHDYGGILTVLTQLLDKCTWSHTIIGIEIRMIGSYTCLMVKNRYDSMYNTVSSDYQALKEA